MFFLINIKFQVIEFKSYLLTYASPFINKNIKIKDHIISLLISDCTTSFTLNHLIIPNNKFYMIVYSYIYIYFIKASFFTSSTKNLKTTSDLGDLFLIKCWVPYKKPSSNALEQVAILVLISSFPFDFFHFLFFFCLTKLPNTIKIFPFLFWITNSTFVVKVRYLNNSESCFYFTIKWKVTNIKCETSLCFFNMGPEETLQIYKQKNPQSLVEYNIARERERENMLKVETQNN